MEISEQSKQYLVKVAKEAIFAAIDGNAYELLDPPKDVVGSGAVFVTIEKDGELRGCIGTLEPVLPVYKAVAEYAVKAAMEDNRFSPVVAEELGEISVEVSILSPIQEISVSSPEELLKHLDEKKPGVLLVYGSSQSTFLPHVWEELPEAKVFLANLCMKAGLPPDMWKLRFDDMEFFEYSAIICSEGKNEKGDVLQKA